MRRTNRREAAGLPVADRPAARRCWTCPCTAKEPEEEKMWTDTGLGFVEEMAKLTAQEGCSEMQEVPHSAPCAAKQRFIAHVH